MMKHGVSLAGLALLLLGSVGCIASVKNNRFGSDREVVAVGGQVYVVNKANGDVMKVDLGKAHPFVPDTDSD